MKMKKRLLFVAALVAAAMSAVSCYDDTELWNELDTMKSRITALENAYKELTDYKTIMQNMQAVESVVQNADGSYTINFYGGADPITISSGAAGSTGAAGKDGKTPSFKIEDGYWYVSYDDGTTWTKIGEAAGNNLFQNAYMDGDFLVLVLIDGTEVRINTKGGPGGEGGGPGQGGEGGDPGQGGGVPTMEDWVGSWSNDDGTIAFYVYSNALAFYAPNSEFGSACRGAIDFNEEDGTVSFTNLYANYDGYITYGNATGGGYIYYYFYPLDAQNQFVENTTGDTLLIGTMSSDKNSFTFTSPLSGVTKMRWYSYLNGEYTYGTNPSNWLGTFSKGGNQGGGDQGGGDQGGDITYTVNSAWKLQYYSNWYYVWTATGNYAFWTVPASSGSLTDDSFIKTTLDDFGTKLAANSDGSVNNTGKTASTKWTIFTGESRYTSAPNYTNNGATDPDGSYYVFMVGVDVTDGVKLTGEYQVITITWQ